MQSMTGYGQASIARDGRQMLLELKTVNHRFLDISFRVPKSLTFLEDVLRKRVHANEIGRGHLDIFVSYQNDRQDAREVKLDTSLLKACDDACRQAIAAVNGAGKVDVMELLNLSGALSITQGEENVTAVSTLAAEAFDIAVADLLKMRRKEGSALATDMQNHLSRLRVLVNVITARAPQVPLLYRERLMTRLAEWNVAVTDPQRITQEVATMADRCAIDEELSRLSSHIHQFEMQLSVNGEMGRKLDFLLQEMNREINTIGSKAADAQITQYVVDAKCTVEKLREQAQNVL